MIDTEGVLPKKYSVRNSQKDEDEALNYAQERVQRYCHSEPIEERLAQIKTQAEDPKFLQILVFDEAHYSATSQKDEMKRETPYSKLLNYINSEKYPNVIVLLVTATPWNLLTVSSKIERTEIKIAKDGQLESCEGELPYLETHRKTRLHEITWNHGFEGDYRVGKKVILEVNCSQYS